jgi:hypothetical protein
LEQHPQIANYVAIDDMELNPGLENHFVKAAHGKLTKKEAAEALKILNS